MTPSEKQIVQLYVGMFNRAPDPAGLAFWKAQADAGYLERRSDREDWFITEINK